MAQKTLTAKLKQKYDTAANWTSNNPVLLAGELGFTTGGRFKMGDGTTAWNNLRYVMPTFDYVIEGDLVANYYSIYNKYTTFTTTSDYVGYYLRIEPTIFHIHLSYTLVTNENKDNLDITPGTTVAYTKGNAITDIGNGEGYYIPCLDKTFVEVNDIDDSLSTTSKNPIQNKVIANLIPSNASSSNKLATMSDVGGGSSTDVQVNGTSITSNNVANILTNGTYNSSTNKIATMSDLPSAITEISSQYIRITDLSTGVYKLTYNGTKYIYYSGTTLTSTHTVAGGAGAVILTVNRYSTTYWHWYYINGSTSYGTIYFGYTSSSTGATSSKQLNSLLTSISSYVKDNLTYSTSGTTYALSAYQGYKLNQNKQDKLPTTTTAGQVLKSTSTAGTVEWGANTPTLPSDIAYFVEESGTPSESLPYYTKNEVDALVATPHNHTIRSIAVTYESSSSTSANWSISVSLNAGEYISGFMWVPSGDGSYENNRMWKPDGAPTFSTSSIVSSATVVTITVPIARGSSGGTCSIKGVVFVTKVS